ncbi:hypothetical protein K144316041_p21380 (plasmid) [Clostridium tetani]|uniref:hypothetical protein n=1 Tax=Clostridium tetani TaxID=1513 RepID=UPI002954694E|nr:hypothetical protein [Clostridium tetani]BDR74299.1 hypothetical protein K144316041_p21380 [Clostridium tetani]
MNLNSLELKEYKNRKELCGTLGVTPAQGGRNIKLQDEEFKRYFEWKKTTGHKLRVVKIYDVPKPKVDNKGKNPNSHHNQNGLYGKYIDITLINFLTKVQKTLEKNEEMYFTVSILAQYSYMVNMNYTTVKNNRQKFYQYLYGCNKKINPTEVKDVILSLSDTVRSVINSALERLERQGIIDFEQGYIIVEEECEYKIHTRMATNVEVKNIKMWEDEILKDLKTEKGKVRFSNKKLNKFYFELDNKIKSEYPYIEQVFQGYKIKVLSKIKVSNAKFENAKEKLNKVVIEETLKKCKRKRNKVVEDKGEYIELHNSNWNRWDLDRLDQNYISNALEIINTVVKTGVENIAGKIRNIEVVKNKSKKNNKITRGMYDDFIMSLCYDGFTKDEAISLYPFEDIKEMVG